MNKRTQERVWIRADVVRVARECGYPEGVAPAWGKYREHGRFPVYRVVKLFGGRTWAGAVQRLGLIAARTARESPRHRERRLIAQVRAVARACGRPLTMPSKAELEAQDGPSYQWVRECLAPETGTWKEAAAACGLAPQRTWSHDISPDDLLDLYRKVARKSGCEPGENGPGVHAFREACGLTVSVVDRHFGSWNGFVEAAGYTPRPRKGWNYQAA
jgi:hypothetical protein